MTKRFFDTVIALLLLIVLFPIISILFGLILIILGRPAIFIQKRPGINAKVFNLYKFRSMTNAKDNNGDLLPDEQRLTLFGMFLRSSSLDELPSLFNVVKGEMSLVGPRPLLIEYLPLYTEEQARRHKVRPGITGWAQVNGRNAISWEEKFNLDVWYVDHQSFWLDVKIIFLTIKKVFFRDGISAQGEATMPKFTGSKSQ